MSQNIQIEKIARHLAAAYWRGRLELIRVTVHEQGAIESMIAAGAENDFESWKRQAKDLVEN